MGSVDGIGLNWTEFWGGKGGGKGIGKGKET